MKIGKYHLSSSRLISSQYTHIYPRILLLLVLLIYHFSIKNRFASRDRYPCLATGKSGIYFSSYVAVLDDPLCIVFPGLKRIHLPAWILQSTREQMKVKRYPHVSSSALVRTAILLPITLVSEFLTIFSATSSHNKQNCFSDSKKDESWGKNKEITPENVRRLQKAMKKKIFQECLIL